MSSDSLASDSSSGRRPRARARLVSSACTAFVDVGAELVRAGSRSRGAPCGRPPRPASDVAAVPVEERDRRGELEVERAGRAGDLVVVDEHAEVGDRLAPGLVQRATPRCARSRPAPGSRGDARVRGRVAPRRVSCRQRGAARACPTSVKSGARMPSPTRRASSARSLASVSSSWRTVSSVPRAWIRSLRTSL